MPCNRTGTRTQQLVLYRTRTRIRTLLYFFYRTRTRTRTLFIFLDRTRTRTQNRTPRYRTTAPKTAPAPKGMVRTFFFRDFWGQMMT